MRLSFYLLLLLSSAILLTICWRPAFSADFKVHPPQTEAEKVLGEILSLEAKDAGLAAFALGIPTNVPATDKRYGQFFTTAFLNALRKTQADLIQSDCGGIERDDEPCGFGFNPIVCGQDVFDVYLFRTIKAGEGSVIVAVHGSEVETVADEKEFVYYSMIRQEGVWKVDGIDCRDGGAFNMPSVR